MRDIANNFTRLREVNAELVKTALKSAEHASKAELAAATGLSVATCANILSDMLDRGEAREVRLGVPVGGRPPRLYAYSPSYSLTALVFPKADASGKRLIYAVIDALGGTLERERPEVATADLDALSGLIGNLRRKYKNVKAAAVSIPGLVRDGRVGFSDLPELDGVDVGGVLADAHAMPVGVENDTNLAALGFHHRLFGGGTGSVAYLAAPSRNCAGAGLVADGRLLRGHTAFAGELSFMPFGVGRERQFAGLTPKQTLDYMATLAAAVVPVFNPAALAVALADLDEAGLEKIRRFCLKRIPAEHMPELVKKESIDDDCMAGLALTAASNLAGRVRLVENRP